MTDNGALARFHPEVRGWFEATYRAPTDVQRQSWPVIGAGEHALITAPTGSGKTLTAFLSVLDRFATGDLETGGTRVLYVSPLKALNTDIARNLLVPLDALRARFAERGLEYPNVRVLTRSGDTPSEERQRMMRRPPEILVTTPESLLLILSTPRGRQMFTSLDTVVMDEVHALVDSRRGVVLITMLERLTELAGEFQRVALSATVKPLEMVARWVGGNVDGTARDVRIVRSRDEKAIVLDVVFPEGARNAALNAKPVWEPLSEAFRDTIASHSTTLFFTNGRRLTEKIVHAINAGADEPLVYAHHGSLARDIRTEVEQRLKAGRLRAIVATSSLEMGIDVGDLDEVVLVQSPPTIAATLQRVGRAGHRVGETSHGTLVPTHTRDFVEAAALSKAVAMRDIEELKAIEGALDVLAQIVVALTVSETWRVDALYALVRRAYPYRALERRQFDLVIEMLAGRYAGTRIRDLKARIVLDRETGEVRANRGAAMALYTSGGTIPNRGLFQLRHTDSNVQIGELDEEYVWEASIGQVFSLGSQSWRIDRITHNDVFARPAPSDANAPPFWRAETQNRSFHYSERIGEFLEEAEHTLEAQSRAALLKKLIDERRFDRVAAEELCDLLERQRDAAGAPLPHRRHLLVEHVHAGPGGYKGPDDEHQLVLHTGWGGRVNRPFALALKVAWRDRFDSVPDIHADNNVIALKLQEERDPPRLLELVSAGNVESLLKRALEDSGFFGARFRECAGRALLLTRMRFKERLPLWMSRLQAKKLMTAVKRYADFPILLETWRTCLTDEFDLVSLHRVLEELENGEIDVSYVDTMSPSPFAATVAFGQISRYMYATDTPEQTGPSALAEDLIRNATFDAALRPKLRPDAIAAFEAKRRRTAEGYRPEDPQELAEYLKERVIVPREEWHAAGWGELPTGVGVGLATADGRAFLVHRESARHVARELFGLLRKDLPDIDDPRDTTQLVRETLSWYGPRTLDELAALLPVARAELERMLNALVDEEELVAGRLLDEGRLHYCDADNLEAILRLQRALQRPRFEPVDGARLMPFLARWQRFGREPEPRAITESLGRLRGFVAPVEVWLDDLVAARHRSAEPHHLDAALLADELLWVGTGRETITFVAPHDLDLLAREPVTTAIASAFTDPRARYPFFQLADATGLPLGELNTRLWEAVWAGEVTADGVAPLRLGVQRNFELAQADPTRLARADARRRARRMATGWPGNWQLVPYEPVETDPVTELERAKERARVMLDRYGVLTREHANREGGPFRWTGLFRALRVMELAGEVQSGLFVDGLSGPQFASTGALRLLQTVGMDQAYWCSAIDPISPCGLGLSPPGPALPSRRPGNYVAFVGAQVVLVVESWGKRLSFADPLPEGAFTVCAELLTHVLRAHLAGHGMRIESIDGMRPDASPRVTQLAEAFDVLKDHRGMELRLGRM